MQSFIRMFFTSVVLLLIMGAVDEGKACGDSTAMEGATHMKHPAALVLPPVLPTNALLITGPYVPAMYVGMKQQRNHHSAYLVNLRLKEADSDFGEIKPILSARKGSQPRRIPRKEPLDPPSC